MSDFEYIVSFYGLLLGLAVANVAVGFADMWRDREKQAAGWCAPLLAGTVLLGAMNTWLSTWSVHETVRVDPWQMIAALGICLPYVFVSRAMTPPEDSRIGLEEHYLKSRVPILIALALPPIFAIWSKVRLDHFHYREIEEIWLMARMLLPLALTATASRNAHAIGLGALNILLVAGLFR